MWVNANPQILNEEETLGYGTYKPNCGPTVNSYKLYDYCVPKTHKRVRTICQDLIRMKSNIENDLSGFNGETLLSSIYNTPSLSMPLNRSVFVSSNPRIIRQMYGGNGPFEESLKNYSQNYGSVIFTSWFDEIKNIMTSLSNKNQKYRVRIQKDTDEKIQQKLENFKKAEEKILELLQEVIHRKHLFNNSYGRLDIGQIHRGENYEKEREDRRLALEKHSNLLKLMNVHQRRAINLTDIIRTLAEAVAEKYESKKDKSSIGDFGEKIRYYK